tara:strand:+ start:1872 stop:2141 length:270 start_codon:yes stop_codon:yes gene_type:complete
MSIDINKIVNKATHESIDATGYTRKVIRGTKAPVHAWSNVNVQTGTREDVKVDHSKYKKILKHAFEQFGKNYLDPNNFGYVAWLYDNQK